MAASMARNHTRQLKGPSGRSVDSDEHQKGWHVFEDKQRNLIYDVNLRLVNLANNNNKYYRIQLLESDQKKGYILYTRWGRHGYDGQNATQTFSISAMRNAQDAAVRAFQQRFYEKTRNQWGARDFNPVEGKYIWDSHQQQAGGQQSAKKLYKPSELSQDLQNLLELVCDEDHVDQEISEIGYNVQKQGLSEISSHTIHEAWLKLKKIHIELNNVNRTQAQLMDLTSQYFQLIPHDMGFKNMAAFNIDSAERLQKEVTLLRRLEKLAARYNSNHEIADTHAGGMNTMDSEGGEGHQEPKRTHPLDIHYRKLGRSIVPLPKTHDMFLMVDYLSKQAHAKRHAHFKLKLENIFGIGDGVHDSTLVDSIQHRRLLFYGARLRDWGQILQHGFEMPNTSSIDVYKNNDCGMADANDTISMDEDWVLKNLGSCVQKCGPGIYFQDILSVAAENCHATSDDGIGFVMICEVVLGNTYEVTKEEPWLNAKSLAECEENPLLKTLGLKDTAMMEKHEGGLLEFSKKINYNSVLAVGSEIPTQFVNYSSRKLEKMSSNVAVQLNGDVEMGDAQDSQMGEDSQMSTGSKTNDKDYDVMLGVGKIVNDLSLPFKTVFAFNEYVVYDKKQIIPRFLCQFQFVFES